MSLWATCLAGCLIVAPVPMLAAQTPARQPRDNPGARAAYFMRGRHSPDLRSPAEHLMAARAERRGMLYAYRAAHELSSTGAAGFSPTGSGTWQALGPQPLDTTGSTDGASGPSAQDYGAVSGRVTAIAIDGSDPTGNTIYVGAAFGGIWKSTNALSASPTFTPLDDGVPTLSVGAIAVDDSTSPSTILVGTGEPNSTLDSYYGEGLLLSNDGDKTWTQITSADNGAESFVGLGFSRILFDPTNPDIVLAGLDSNVNDYEEGTNPALGTNPPTGVYRSTDHGKTWSAVLLTYSATDLTYDAVNHVYYAAIQGMGIYKSSDSGATWTSTDTPFARNVPANRIQNNDVEFARASLAARGGVVYALIGDESGGFGTVATPTPCTASKTPNCDTGLVQSTNGGTTWTPIPLPDTSARNAGSIYCQDGSGSSACQSLYDMEIAAPAGGTGLLVGGLDLWSTPTIPAMTANGVSSAWTNLTNAYAEGEPGNIHTDQHAISMLDDNIWFVGNDGGIWSTANAGSSWQDLNATLDTLQFQGVSPDQQTAGTWIGGSQDNGTAKLSGSGLSWTRWYWGDGGFTATNPEATQEYFTENYDVGVWRSDHDGTETDNTLTDVVDADVVADASAFYVPFVVRPAPNTDSLLLGTCRIWAGPDNDSSTPVSTDWFPYSNDLTTGGSGAGTCANNGSYITDVAVSASNPDVAWAVTDDGNVERTDDLTAAAAGAPATWTSVVSAPLLDNYVYYSSVAINPVNPNIVYIGVQDFGIPHVYKTSDGGSTWTDISGNLPDAPVNWILIDPLGPNTNIYVASDVGVFVATDGGTANEQWMQVGQGLPDTAVLQLALSPASWPSRELVAATHGRGMWEITPLATPSFTLGASPAAQTVLAGTAASFTVTATGSDGEQGPITLSCTAPASGCTVSLASIAPGDTAAVTLASSAVAQGANTVTVSGTDGIITATTSATITGEPFVLAATPATQNVNAGSAAALTVQLSAIGAFNQPVALSCTAPTSGCTVTPASLTGNGTASVSVAAGALTTGANAITVTGTSGSVNASTSASVNVHDFSLALASTLTSAIGAGNAATLNLTTTAGSGGFSGTLALSCTAPSSGCTVAPASVSAGGSATVTVAGSALSPGADTITVTAASGPLSHSASANLSVQGFTIAPPSGTASSASIAAGQTATYSLQFTSAEGFNSPVSLSCSGAPAEATCSVSPSSLTPTSAGVMAIVTVSTAAASMLAPLPGGASGPLEIVLLLLGLVAAALTLAWVWNGAPDWDVRWPARVLGVVLLASALLAASCGGSSSSPVVSQPTPAGSYHLAITAVSGKSSHTIELTLRVQ
ncbi:MAG: hypothetical protein ACRD1Y_08095 [Terriglobales bacterium]